MVKPDPANEWGEFGLRPALLDTGRLPRRDSPAPGGGTKLGRQNSKARRLPINAQAVGQNAENVENCSICMDAIMDHTQPSHSSRLLSHKAALHLSGGVFSAGLRVVRVIQ